MNVLFAPDYTAHNPYQQLLAGALGRANCHVEFLSQYRRGLPLTRGCRGLSKPELLHLHWPEAYFRSGCSRLSDWLRALRFPFDLRLASRRRHLVVTAHNLYPHTLTPLSRSNMRATYRKATRILAHSKAGAKAIGETFGVSLDSISVVPHGDLAPSIPTLPDKARARNSLGVEGHAKIALMFGALAPYKGIEAAVSLWNTAAIDVHLFVVGESFDRAYGDQLQAALGRAKNATLVRRRVDERELAQWMAATDLALFNYENILTSGSACLARSLGIPVVLPKRLATIDLGEPNPRVIRFNDNSDLARAVDAAITAPDNPEMTAAWRRETSWAAVAEQTRNAYELALAV